LCVVNFVAVEAEPRDMKLHAISVRGATLSGMVDITIHTDRLTFNVEGLHQLWALRSDLDIPLAHIVGVEVNPAQAGA
jgi:hypothetical protein